MDWKSRVLDSKGDNKNTIILTRQIKLKADEITNFDFPNLNFDFFRKLADNRRFPPFSRDRLDKANDHKNKNS